MIKSNLKLSKLLSRTLLSLRTPLSTTFYDNQPSIYPLASDFYKIDLFYMPSQSFAKMTKKKEEKIQHSKEREQADVPKEIDLTKQEKGLNKALEHFKTEISKLKVGRLMPSSFEELKVPAYGEKAGLSTLCQIVVKNATTIQLNVFDESSIPTIIKIVEHSDLNVQVKRLDKSIICTLQGGNTKEAKEAVVKILKGHLDQLKSKTKEIRAEGVDYVKKYKKFVSEDVIHNVEKELNSMHAKTLEEAEKQMKAKEKEIMS